MKLNIKKLYMENFKGLKGAHIVEFGQSITFLFGPNGYGKTTIFDALELLLTGRILRIENENNEHGAKRHESSVIHHSKDSEIILKLLVEFEGREFVIARKLPKSVEKLGLDKFWQELETYIIDTFDSPLPESLATLSQQDLEKQIFGDSNKDYLSQYLRLLTYVPQTEAIYFLKMSQSERYSKLSPLLDMSEQGTSLEMLRDYRKKLFTLKGHLENRLKEYDEIPENNPKETIPYSRLTQTDEIAIYDEPKPFDGLSIFLAKEKRKRISEELDSINEFLENFKPKEYAKLKINNRLREIFKNETFVDSLIFEDIDQESMSKVEQGQSLASAARSQNFTHKFVLREYLSPSKYEELERMRLSYLKYRSVILDDSGERRSTRSMLVILSDKSNGFTPETQARSSQYLDEFIRLERSVNASQQLLKQIQEYRSHVVSHAHKLSQVVDDKDCPLCGYDWSSQAALAEAIKQKTDDLQSLISTEAKSLIDRERSIKIDFLDELATKGAGYLEKHAALYKFFSRIRQYGPLNAADIRNFDLLLGVASEAKDLIVTTSDFDADFISRAQKLQDIIEQKAEGYDKRVISRLRNVSSYNFNADNAFIAHIKLQLPKSDMAEKALRLLSYENLCERVDDYRKEAQSYIQKNEVDSVAISSSYLYKQLFNEIEESFSKAKGLIGQKLNYIEQQFTVASMESRKKYLEQYSVLAPLSDKMYSLSKEFDKSLKKYQFGLTQPLKAPFYIYSAKILQNNPNGQGIFIKTDADRSSIVFCANGSTTHDALHQLSSGQLAVVSMAFHLAMNAVYTNKSLSLLIIDDPIQDMDSLNIHSLSELMRREFVTDYQIIMSTHDDLDMQYLKFMLGQRVAAEAIKAWNVQKLFYETHQP